ncbi:MAG TPA: histidine kinase dimerization/phospho-acceptor domain-containing protein [Geminicoccaceae bacterium]|nr:histidine kinase dimerization/phospho-acceptor domain-containing protein [Geminicoccaceae bacterium]
MPAHARPGDRPIGALADEPDGENDGRIAGLRGGGVPSVSWPRLGHDLRTPLNAILGNTELLLDGSAGPLSSQARACLGDIQAAGRRMMNQVQVLLELCRLRARPTPGSAVTLDLIELLRGAHAATLADDAPMRVAPTGARLVVRGDAAWLEAAATALIELYHGVGPAGSPLRATIEPPAHDASGAGLLLSWGDFRPDEMAALPLALIDAILDLHEGEAALTADGLRLYWPVWRVVQLEPAALLLASRGECP